MQFFENITIASMCVDMCSDCYYYAFLHTIASMCVDRSQSWFYGFLNRIDFHFYFIFVAKKRWSVGGRGIFEYIFLIKRWRKYFSEQVLLEF